MSKMKSSGAVRLLALLIAAIFICERAINLFLDSSNLGLSPFSDVVSSILLTAAMFPILYYAVFREISGKNEALEASESRLRSAHNWMEQCIDERTKEIRTANTALEKTVQSLNDNRREMDILSQMGRLLQACHSLPEVCGIAEDHIKQLFPQLSGSLYLANEAHKTFEKMTDWGEDAPFADVFDFTECWALRHGRPHEVDGKTHTVTCRHTDEKSAWHLCVPLMAHSETLGMLCLSAGEEAALSIESDSRTPEERANIYVMLADSMALAIASLRLRESLEHQAIRDPLTGLFNRRYLIETLDRELMRARRAEEPLSLVMIDIDHFKQINDTYGHGAGDAVLEAVGAKMRNFVRGEDIVCRYGGEEFAIVLPGTAADVALRRIEILREEIKTISIRYQNDEIQNVSVSAGIGDFPIHGEGRETLMRSTDEALYSSKRDGRDRSTIARVATNASEQQNQPLPTERPQPALVNA